MLVFAMRSKQRLARFCSHWHRRLSWLGGLAVIIWAVSGISHPLMSWTGPKAVAFYPPAVRLSAESLSQLQVAAADLMGVQSAVTKLVAYQNRTLLQITEEVGQVRRYFDLESSQWLEHQDVKQAKWLASYYTGRDVEDIVSAEFLTEFSADYPSVNRLLPVYRLRFSGDEQLQAYIYTESSALASLNDSNKRKLQQIFRQLHTWSFLDATGVGRLLLIGLMMLSLFLMASAGVGLVLSIKQRHIPNASRRWHRYIAYGIWLPLMSWSFSGFYHLLQAELVQPVSGMHLDKPIALTSLGLSKSEMDRLAARSMETPLRSVSMVGGADGEAVLRLGIGGGASSSVEKRPSMHAHAAHKVPSRAERYAGLPSEKTAIYLSMETGQEVDLSDSDRARDLALSFTDLNASEIESVTMITRFGDGYDFRNKRLPVWRVAFRDESRRHLFIDPVTGVLVDQSRQVDRRESWVFSVMHKWNPLAVIGRQNRDIVVVCVLLLALGFTVLGYMMLLRKRAP